MGILKPLCLATLMAAAVSAQACTGITLHTVDQQMVQARTMEWGLGPLDSRLVVSPRQFEYESVMPDGQAGKTWTARFGFVGISYTDNRFAPEQTAQPADASDASPTLQSKVPATVQTPLYEATRYIAEGMNEAGLSVGVYYFPFYGSLVSYRPPLRNGSITDLDVARYLLSQFKSVEEIKEAINDIRIVPSTLLKNGKAPATAHWRIADKNGKTVVLEITTKGDVHFYNASCGVITNAPDYPWQLKNLNNYINLKPGNAAPQRFGDYQTFSFGVGTGAIGLPGDITPPSRFVRAAFYVKTAPDYQTRDEAVRGAFHMLNNFDHPIGMVYDDPSKIPEDLQTSTLWTTASDLSGGIFYYKTRLDSAVKSVDLKQIDFVRKSPAVLPLDSGEWTVTPVSVPAP